jgi:hypothetical protein
MEDERGSGRGDWNKVHPASNWFRVDSRTFTGITEIGIISSQLLTTRNPLHNGNKSFQVV